ncbi:MAG: metallophosphoesterase, partial [Halobacteriota archaeon]
IGTLVRGPHAKKYPLGRYRIGGMVQYTSRGLGTNVFWIRINCPPEITVFTLTSKEEGS